MILRLREKGKIDFLVFDGALLFKLLLLYRFFGLINARRRFFNIVPELVIVNSLCPFKLSIRTGCDFLFVFHFLHAHMNYFKS